MKRYLKRSLTGLLLIAFSFVILSPLPVQASESAEKYGALIGDKYGNFKLYDNLTVVSPKGNVMVKANAISSKLELTYKYDSKNKKLTITNADNGKSLIFTRNSKTYLYYSNKDAKGKKKTSSYQFYYDQATKCNVIHMATLKYLVNYNYYSSTKAKQYKEIGCTGGIVVYSNYKNISSLPPIKAAETGVVVNSKASGTVAGVIPGIGITYDSSIKLSKNIDNLNNALGSVYGRGWTIENTLQDPEQVEPSDWIMVVDGNKIGIDISTWRSSYNSDTDKNKYLNAILETFRFFCGDNMGNSLWLLVDDMMINNGADETIYGFEHDGGRLFYKNGHVVTYEFKNNDSELYLWFTPSNY